MATASFLKTGFLSTPPRRPEVSSIVKATKSPPTPPAMSPIPWARKAAWQRCAHRAGTDNPTSWLTPAQPEPRRIRPCPSSSLRPEPISAARHPRIRWHQRPSSPFGRQDHAARQYVLSVHIRGHTRRHTHPPPRYWSRRVHHAP